MQPWKISSSFEMFEKYTKNKIPWFSGHDTIKSKKCVSEPKWLSIALTYGMTTHLQLNLLKNH